MDPVEVSQTDSSIRARYYDFFGTVNLID